MNKPHNSLGILGGTFDPIHQGHLSIAKQVLDTFQLDQIAFIPCYQPPHRDQPIASPKDRLTMARLATASHPQFVVNEMEIKRKNISYTIDTLRILRANHPEDSLCLIVGSDAFFNFHLWHQWKKIFDLAHIIVISRPPLQSPENDALKEIIALRETKNKNDLLEKTAGCIYFQAIEPIAISATQIRQAIADQKQSINGLEEAVEKYIMENHVYSTLLQKDV